MSAGGVVAFWSYARQDDERDGGGLTRLATRIQDEFALVTGETLTLFLDRTDIRWGEEWRRRIDTALAETTFFIPLITPLYFKRPECRRELLTFVGQAQSLGAIDLVLPILYVNVPDLTEENPDEACALIARMQYFDWRGIRLCAENSAEYRRGINSLAMRLAEISQSHEQSGQPSMAAQNADDGEEEEGLFDLLEAIQEKLPTWEEYTDDSSTIWEQIHVILRSYFERVKKVGSASGPQLNLMRKAALEVEPLVHRDLALCKAYLAASIELDPIVLSVLRNLDHYPEFTYQVLAALSPLERVYATIAEDDKREDQYQEIREVFARYMAMSKDVKRVTKLIEVVNKYGDDGNSLVRNWHREIQKYSSDGK
jgi:hypothetical protein